MLTLNFLIHFSPLCSGTPWFGSQSTTCTLFFHLSCKVLAFSKVSSTNPILWWPYTFSVFLFLSQELEKFLLEDQIVNILGLWTLQSLSQLHIASWKHSLKTCKWMGMTLLQQNFVHGNRQSENGPEFFNSSSKSSLQLRYPLLRLLITQYLFSLLDCRLPKSPVPFHPCMLWMWHGIWLL